MIVRKYYFLFVFLFVSPILLLHTTSCKKEYSYEGGDSTITKKDSIILPPVFEFPLCSLCKVDDPVLEGKWNFKTGDSYLCGVIDNGIITGDKNAFTFFGPSACSIDSGIVMTVYLYPIRLDADMFKVTTNKVAFYYYDHKATSYIFISQSTVNFSLTVDSYIFATGIASGTFSGGVFKANGETAFIREGRFKVKLR